MYNIFQNNHIYNITKLFVHHMSNLLVNNKEKVKEIVIENHLLVYLHFTLQMMKFKNHYPSCNKI